LAVLVLAVRCTAADQPSGGAATNAPPPLASEVKLVEGTGLIPARYAYLTTGKQKFSFVVPARFRLEMADQEKLVLVTSDLSATLTFRLAGPLPPNLQGLTHSQCRDWFSNNYPGAGVQQELSMTAANQSGPAFDAQWNANSLQQRMARVAYFPSRAGVIELSLVCTEPQFKTLQYDFNFVLLTFRASDESGHLDLPVLSNKI
jgi:hypothetical protein